MRFSGKTILITGGSSGIGAATARLFSQEGATVFVLDQEPFRDRVSGAIDYFSCDVSNESEVRKVIQKLLKKTKQIDYLFCNAGVYRVGTIEESTPEDLQTVIAINLFGTIYCMQQVLPVMKRQRFGSIVLMASDQAWIAKTQCAIYGASKAAIAHLTKSTALDYAAYGIRVNCVCPGPVDTPLYRQAIQALRKSTSLSVETIEDRIKQELPLKRVGKPEEIAGVVCFLCSEAASFMTGAALNVDGGYTIQ